MGAPINPIPNISNTQYSYTPFLLNLGVIIKHPKPPNLAILKLGIRGFRGIGLLSSKIVPVTPKIKNFQNLGVLGIMGGLFYIALFHSKWGPGDQDFQGELY